MSEPSARLLRVRLDADLWANAPRERRVEWRAAVRDLLDGHRFDTPGPPFELAVSCADAAGRLEARDGEAVLFVIAVPAERLRPHLDEYLEVCRKMAKLGGGRPTAPRLEAFDIAKRIIHDEAAETLLEICRELRPDHATCRRLFTLLVTLHVDTTRLFVAHHRR